MGRVPFVRRFTPPAFDKVLTSDKMKSLLALSKKEVAQAAIGLTRPGRHQISLRTESMTGETNGR
jgi:hypothetical protein